MTRKYSKIDAWVSSNQGNHYCHCGCGRAIEITRHHWKNGIPKFIHGHGGRRNLPKNGYKTKEEILSWIEFEQGKHICECGCGEIIEITYNHYQNGIPKYIDRHQSRIRKGLTDVERFWICVDKRGEDDCWNWIPPKSKPKLGYAYISSDKPCVKNLAHRLSYFIHYGEFDSNLDILHKCDHPCCVNPNHLFLGTHRDNMEDAARKKRFKHKYSEEQILTVVKLKLSGVSTSNVAIATNVSRSDVCSIMNGKTWRSTTGIERRN